MRAIILSILILFSSSIFAAESRSQISFVVKAKPDTVKKWVESHPNEILKSSGAQIITRNDKKVKVKHHSKKGDFTFTIQEKTEKNGFSTQMIETDNKELKNQSSKMTISSHKGGKTEITVEMNAEVVRDDMIAIDIKVDLNKSIRGVRKLLEKEFKAESSGKSSPDL